MRRARVPGEDIARDRPDSAAPAPQSQGSVLARSNSGAQAGLVLQLQRSAGNRAVARLLQRQTPTSTVITGEELVVSGDPDRARAVAPLEQHLCERADDFMNIWLSATTDALDSTPAPAVEDPAAQAGFWLALSGNMLWAATSLMPEWGPVMIPMSMVGAAVGSGSLAPDAPPQPPNPRDTLGRQVHSGRDAVIAALRADAFEIASKMHERGLTDPVQQDRELWAVLFGVAEFENSVALRDIAAGNLRSALADYLAAFNNWLAVTAAEAQAKFDSQREHNTMMAGLTGSGGGGMAAVGLGHQSMIAAETERLRRETPFDPDSVRFDFPSANELSTTIFLTPQPSAPSPHLPNTP